MSASNILKGRFRPKNPGKYEGNKDNIIFRSSWERRTMAFLDQNPNVISWSSEEVIIPYVSPIDNRIHRYFPDFLVRVRQTDGSIRTMLLEVKPKTQTMPPTVSKRKTRRYLTEVATWGVNQAKWHAASEYCADRQWIFKIITEDELGIK